MTDEPKLYWRVVEKNDRPVLHDGETDRIPGCPMTQAEAAAFIVQLSKDKDKTLGDKELGLIPCDPPESN